MNIRCNNAIIRAVAKVYLTFNNYATSLELFEFMKDNEITTKTK